MSQQKNNFFPIFLIIISCLFFSILGGLIKYLGLMFHPFEQAFFRNFLSLLFFIPLMFISQSNPFNSLRKKFLFWRSLFGGVTMLLLFWSYTLIPLSQAMTISFTTPLFMFIGSIILFKEKASSLSILTLIFGFILTIIVLRPDLTIQFGTWVALLAALTHAVAGLMVKDLTKTEPVFTIMFFMVFFMTPFTLIPAIPVWKTPVEIHHWILLLSLAVFGTLGNFFWTKAISLSKMTNIIPFDFSKLIFATLIGFFFFNEKIDLITFFCGSGLIICNLYLRKINNEH